jgi:hypothetical protein
MEQLFRAMSAVLKDVEPNQRTDEALVLAAWNRCAGEQLRDRTEPLEFDKGRLIVAVTDETWRRHLEDLSPRMLVKMNAVLGHGTVRFIEFTVSPGAVVRISETISAAAVHRDLDPSIAAAADAIADEGLKGRFLDAASDCLDKAANNYGR